MFGYYSINTKNVDGLVNKYNLESKQTSILTGNLLNLVLSFVHLGYLFEVQASTQRNLK